jgi:hypothetical protein
MTRGRGSSSGYISVNSEGFAVGVNYMNQLRTGAMAAITPNEPRPTYQGNPSQMFAGTNGFRNLNLYLSGVNNPWAFNMHVQQKQQEKLETEKDAARTMAISYQGFRGVEVNGIVTNPGSLLKDAKAGIANIGPNIIAAAKSIPEVLTSVVTQTITKAVDQGIGNIQATVHKSVSGVRANVNAQLNRSIQIQGPSVLYDGSLRVQGPSASFR